MSISLLWTATQFFPAPAFFRERLKDHVGAFAQTVIIIEAVTLHLEDMLGCIQRERPQGRFRQSSLSCSSAVSCHMPR